MIIYQKRKHENLKISFFEIIHFPFKSAIVHVETAFVLLHKSLTISTTLLLQLQYKMSEPVPYAFEPRRKRSLDGDRAQEEEFYADSDCSDLEPMDNNNRNYAASSETSLPHHAATIVHYCSRDIKLIEPNSTSKCILQLEMIHDAITDSSIKLAWRKAQRDFWHKRSDMLAFSRMTPENHRFHGYQNYVEFVHGHLGKGCRRAIPLCVVKHLRRRYQSANENYRGFQPSVAGDLTDVVCALADLQD